MASLTWDSLQIDGDDHDDLVLDGGDEVAGLDLPQFTTSLVPRVGGRGAEAGPTGMNPATVQARVVALSSAALMNLRQAMKPRQPGSELPLTFEGFGFPATHRLYARPAGMEFRVGPTNIYGDTFVADASWLVPEPVVYSDAQTTAWTVAQGSPVSSAAFEAPNAGTEAEPGAYAWEFSLRASTTLVSPSIRVDHDDDTWERITFQGLSVASGQTLRIRAEAGVIVPRVGSRIVSAHIRSTTQAGVTGRAPRWWRLLPSTGTDDKNEVTISAASGTFSGSCLVRGQW